MENCVHSRGEEHMVEDGVHGRGGTQFKTVITEDNGCNLITVTHNGNSNIITLKSLTLDVDVLNDFHKQFWKQHNEQACTYVSVDHSIYVSGLICFMK